MNKYENKPYPRPLKDSVVRGFKPWEPNPNPGAKRTITREDVEAKRQARRLRSRKQGA